MINGIRLKVCGLTTLVDAEAADAAGADCLGFIFYPKSPRRISLAQYAAMKDRLPPRRKVAVLVEPGLTELEPVLRAGFDFIQIHFKTGTPLALLREWSELVGPARLWLVPKLEPAADASPALLPLADTFMLDTFHPEKFGGTGETGDWAKFKRHREAHPGKTWILSGGLKPDNVAAAIGASGANFLDVNSGVELSPGVKDPARLRAFARALQGASKLAGPA